ncbi:MAG: EFR1 family ferrodoxin [Muribaculaceae bacterium]|nr:EFR1 family ferrodoxin [Muribaculaceae bacterium]
MIIYFSGTGNTRYAALLLAKNLNDDDVREMPTEMLCNPAEATIDISEGDKYVVWAFPTYSWGVPPSVANVMKNAKFGTNAANATHIMLTTCGDDMAYTDRQWRRLMAGRGLKAGGAFSVTMPNTYVLMKGFDVDSEEIASKKIAGCANAVSHIAKSIINEGDDILTRLSFSWVKSKIIYPWFIRYAMSPKPFHCDDRCIGCSKCADNCPTGNIKMLDGHPKWDTTCALCLRCYHICPSKAVCYGKATKGKGQYLLSKQNQFL